MMSNSTPKSVMFSVDDVHLSGFHFDITQTEMPKSIDSDSYSFHIFSGNITLHWKKCSTKNMLIALKTDKYLLEISSMHLTQVQYDLDIDYTTLVLRHAYFFKDKCTFFKTVQI